jgi:VWFA-related protein
MRAKIQSAIALVLALVLTSPTVAHDAGQKSTSYTFRANSDLVLVNVVVRDKNGNLVKDLKKEDFTLIEETKPQTISTFDFENVDQAAQTAATGGVAGTNVLKQGTVLNEENLRDHRLIVIFFDFTSMEPDEVDRAIDTSIKYLDQQMSPADLVGILTLSSSLVLNQDFTGDKDLLKTKLKALATGEADGFEQGTEGTSDGTPDTGGAYIPDDTEYNTFNNDRRLEAIQAIVTGLSKINQKKSMIYFSSGLTSEGLENQAALRNAINAARRSNTAIYTVDSRGLQALPPTGDASTASLRGVSSYNGNAFTSQLNANFSSQETLSSLAEDTGGKALLDTNDLSGVFKQVQHDTSAYYVLGFRSNNPARDGRYRRLTVKVNRPGVKLEYRQGYFAPKDYQHFNKDDKEQQLYDELNSDGSSVDVSLYVGAYYFRLADNKFYIPVSLVVPGSQIPFEKGGDKDKATLDVVGSVRDATDHQIGAVRETVKLNLDQSQEVRRKNVQYNTAFVLPPGSYKLKFVVRENQSGRMGSFVSEIHVPDLKKDSVPVKTSSIVIGSQLVPAAGKKRDANPLVFQNNLLLPNIAHVFSSGQNLYFHYEVYDPAKPKTTSDAKAENAEHLLTSIAFFQGKRKVFETPEVEANVLNAPERHAHIFEFSIPLADLKPGSYTCQVNIIDDAGGAFIFPRTSLTVRAANSTAAGSGR